MQLVVTGCGQQPVFLNYNRTKRGVGHKTGCCFDFKRDFQTRSNNQGAHIPVFDDFLDNLFCSMQNADRSGQVNGWFWCVMYKRSFKLKVEVDLGSHLLYRADRSQPACLVLTPVGITHMPLQVEVPANANIWKQEPRSVSNEQSKDSFNSPFTD